MQRDQAASASAIWDFILPLSCDPLPFLCTVLSAFLLLALTVMGSGSSPLNAGDQLSTLGAHWGAAAALVSTGGRWEAWIAAHLELEHAGSGLFQRDLFRPAPRGEPHPLLGVGSSLPSTPVLGPQVPTIFSILSFPLFFPPSLPFDLCSHLPVDQAVS